MFYSKNFKLNYFIVFPQVLKFMHNMFAILCNIYSYILKFHKDPF